MRITAVLLISLMFCAVFSGCLGQEASEESTEEPKDTIEDKTDNLNETMEGEIDDSEQEDNQHQLHEEPMLTSRDFGLTYWPDNYWTQWGKYSSERHLLTGYYGAAIDLTTGNLDHLGFTDLDVDTAMNESNDLINSMPSALIQYALQRNGTYHEAENFWFSEDDIAAGGIDDNPSALHEMGRFLQYVEIPKITYQDESTARGALHLVSMPRHLVLTHSLPEFNAGDGLKMSLGGDAFSEFEILQNTYQTELITIADNDGNGWSFIPANYAGVNLSVIREPSGELVYEVTCSAQASDCSISVVMVPLNAANETSLDAWLPSTNMLSFSIAQMHLNGTVASQPIASTYDKIRGTHRLDLSSLVQVGGPTSPDWSNLSIHNIYNRHHVILNNAGENPLYVPLSFHALRGDALTITGGSPLLRSMEGEPLGHPLQISKNWHDPPIHWFRLHTSFILDPGVSEFEHTFAHAKWGETYAVQHSQLSLVGWGRNMQQWEESSIGAWGESITYDPDLTLSRSFVDDVRPFLVNASSQWGWTGNVGGANFLVYDHDERVSFADHQLSRTRTYHAATGPCLTEATYSSITADEKITMKAKAQLGRTDDLVRAWYTLEYEFLEDVSYKRLALFQMAADRYGDNGFTKYAYGNENGTMFDSTISTQGQVGYANNSVRGIPVNGQAWGMLYENQWSDGNLPELHGNLVFVVREYSYVTPNETVTTPHLNIVQTNNRAEQVSIEIGVPFNESNPMIPAGTRVELVIEYIVTPASKSAYYGESRWIGEAESNVFQSPDMALMMAVQNKISVDVKTGHLANVYPVVIEVNHSEHVAEFELASGLSYAPITITGLPTVEGYVLQEMIEGNWVRVDQSVHGNDFWQADYDNARKAWSLTFNLQNEGLTRYRFSQFTTV